MQTQKFIITFRMTPEAPQQELTRYTKEAADTAANQILEMGGVAVVTEDWIETPEHTADEIQNPNRGTLSWE